MTSKSFDELFKEILSGNIRINYDEQTIRDQFIFTKQGTQYGIKLFRN